MRIVVVNFGSQWTHRIWRVLKYLDCESEIMPVTTPLEKLNAAGIVLSGGAVRIGKGEAELVKEAHRYLDEFDGAIMGVCAGQQFMALHFGGEVKPAKGSEYGKVELIVDEHNDLFEGLPDKFNVWASHNDEVVKAPGFRFLAHSKNCISHAMKHEKKPFYGTLFHPEVEHTEYGQDIYKNFVRVCKK